MPEHESEIPKYRPSGQKPPTPRPPPESLWDARRRLDKARTDKRRVEEDLANPHPRDPATDEVVRGAELTALRIKQKRGLARAERDITYYKDWIYDELRLMDAAASDVDAGDPEDIVRVANVLLSRLREAGRLSGLTPDEQAMVRLVDDYATGMVQPKHRRSSP